MTDQKLPELKICMDCFIFCEATESKCPNCGCLTFETSSDDDCEGCDDCGCCDGGA